MNIKLTNAAREKIAQVKTPGRYMKLNVTKSGCCSYSFLMYEDEKLQGDEMMEVDGLQILIAKGVNTFIQNATIDYGRRGIMKDFWVKPQ